jgi:hypothetical protein
MKHTLSLDKMLEESKVWLEEKKQNLNVREAALPEALERNIHHRDNPTRTF